MNDTSHRSAEQIAEWLGILIEPGQVVELRALNAPKKYGKPATFFGFFDGGHLDEMARQACRVTDGKASGVYFTLNPVNADLLGRAANRIREAGSGETTSDRDILRRRWLLVDADPKRPAGISASDDEKEHARQVSNAVDAFLFDAGWPAPITADSGNGFHSLYRIDLPADDDDLVKRCLFALAEKFDDDRVSIDTTVFNPSRICKLYGTMARKGDSIAARPHRQSKINNIPTELTPVPIELLEQLAAHAPAEDPKPDRNRISQSHNTTGVLDVEAWLSARNVEILNRDTVDGVNRWFVTCPGIANHTTSNGTKDCVITQESGGRLGGKCFHASCGMRSWDNIRDALGKPTRDDYPSLAGPSAAVPARIVQRPATIVMAAGDRVRAGDRGNFGTVVNDDGGPNVTVHFVSPEGQEATKDIPRTELALADGTPLVPTGFKLNLISSNEFAAADYRQRFLIRHVLTDGQPCIVGGPQKGMKTGLMIEMAVSLGSATPFLGRDDFAVKDAVNVAIISGESGLATLQETAKRVAFAHQVELADCKIWWETRLPKIANPEHLEALRLAIREQDLKVCFLDPAYLCLLSGDTQGRQASNVFDMGSVLQGLNDVGQDTGCGIVLAHHTRKNPAEKFAIPDLTELAYAGFGEFARQWLLLNRRSEYEPGRHELWLSIGGSAGHSSCWSLDIEEGVPDEEFRGRYWQTTVRPATEVIQQKKDDRQRQKENDRHSRMLTDLERIAELLRKADAPMTKNEIRDQLGLDAKHFASAFAEVLKRNLVSQTEKKASNGRKYDAYTFTVG